MKSLTYALQFFFVVDALMFALSVADPNLLLQLLPQFAVTEDEHFNQLYARCVGALFLLIGIGRLYGGLYITEKGAFEVSLWTWVVELIHLFNELRLGTMAAKDNILGLVLAPLMLGWSLSYYNRTFLQKTSKRD